MAILVIERFIYSPQESLILITAVLINGVALYTAGFMETRGTHMQYSKFWNQMKSSSDSQTPAKVSSRIGMLIFYTPAFLGGVIGLVLFPDESLRFVLLASCLTIHFLKRDLEVISLTICYSFWRSVIFKSKILVQDPRTVLCLCIVCIYRVTHFRVGIRELKSFSHNCLCIVCIHRATHFHVGLREL